MFSKEELISKFDYPNSENAIQYLYHGLLKKEEVYNFLNYDKFKEHSIVIIKHFGNNIYNELESEFVKKMIKDNVSIEYFKQRFNCNLLERYKNILSDVYGFDVIKNWLDTYNIS